MKKIKQLLRMNKQNVRRTILGKTIMNKVHNNIIREQWKTPPDGKEIKKEKYNNKNIHKQKTRDSKIEKVTIK